MSSSNLKTQPRYDEMRRHPRVAFEVAVNMESEHNFYAGITDNISEGGLFIATVDAPPIGAVIEVQLHLPFREEPFWLRGEVRWHRPLEASIPGAPAGCGVRFVSVPTETARAVTKFVKARDTILFDVD